MKRSILAVATAILAVGAMPTVGSAKNHDEPGVPGAPNCHGQTMAYFNEIAEAGFGVHGIGNLAKADEISVQDLQALVDEYCNPPDDDNG